ncbi:Substrate-specific component STY3230 of queuosine-regulated ECF transporter, partial [Arthrobacter sp. DR-2P]
VIALPDAAVHVTGGRPQTPAAGNPRRRGHRRHLRLPGPQPACRYHRRAGQRVRPDRPFRLPHRSRPADCRRAPHVAGLHRGADPGGTGAEHRARPVRGQHPGPVLPGHHRHGPHRGAGRPGRRCSNRCAEQHCMVLLQPHCAALRRRGRPDRLPCRPRRPPRDVPAFLSRTGGRVRHRHHRRRGVRAGGGFCLRRHLRRSHRCHRQRLPVHGRLPPGRHHQTGAHLRPHGQSDCVHRGGHPGLRPSTARAAAVPVHPQAPRAGRQDARTRLL